MQPDEHTTTDPIQTEGGHHQGRSRYGFWGTLVGLPRLEHRIKEILMARLDPVTAALSNASTALSDLGNQITKLAGQIGDLQAGTVTQEEIDAVAASATSLADGITSAAAAVDAAIEVPGEDDIAPPPTEPTP